MAAPDQQSAGAPAPWNGAASVGHPVVFPVLLLLAMGVSTFTASSLGILATFVIDDLSITRAQLGGVIAVINIGAAVFSLPVGRFTDHIGGKLAFLGVFAASGAAFIALAVAPWYILLYAGAAVAAIAQAGANPSTNKLIALHLPLGRRGVVTGIKQSGVQAAIFAGGLLLPAAAEIAGWRWTLAAVALLCFGALPVIGATVPADRGTSASTRGRATQERLPAAIWWLAVYGFLLGLSGSVTFLVPLFAEEALGFSPRVGGAAAAAVGLTAFFGRIGWARLAERRGQFPIPLGMIAALAVAANALFLVSQSFRPGMMLFAAALLTGAGSSSWNSVGMLAVMNEAGPGGAGRASGVVMFGFLTGLGIGPPIFGWIVDVTGAYTVMWVASMVVAALAVGLTTAWHRSPR